MVIDGANVALFGQNFADGGFSMQQIELMLQEVETFKPGARTLLVRLTEFFITMAHTMLSCRVCRVAVCAKLLCVRAMGFVVLCPWFCGAV